MSQRLPRATPRCHGGRGGGHHPTMREGAGNGQRGQRHHRRHSQWGRAPSQPLAVRKGATAAACGKAGRHRRWQEGRRRCCRRRRSWEGRAPLPPSPSLAGGRTSLLSTCGGEKRCRRCCWSMGKGAGVAAVAVDFRERERALGERGEKT